MMKISVEISIVVPVDTGDSSWRPLLNQLKSETQFKEIVISAMDAPPADWDKIKSAFQIPLVWWVNSKRGRSAQMNNGAEQATGQFIWFVHADSEIHAESFDRLNYLLTSNPTSLVYFDLKFSCGSYRMKINEIGVKIRSNLFKMPFGDQGLCISRNLFYQVGRYNEETETGEDLEFVVKCQRSHIELCPTGIWIKTSPRKYSKNGWLETTFEHLKLSLSLKSKFKKINRIAIAIFVKTPGYSPIKTRLGKTHGQEFAEGFYRHSVFCIKDLMTELKTKHADVDVYWAIAEELHLVSEHWPDFFKIPQGSGSLGQRLHQVYNSLLKNYKSVILIGSDSPQLSLAHLDAAIQQIKSSDFLIGRAHDGGFYLFAGQKVIAENIWNSVPYSVDNTSEKLVELLSADSKVSELEESFDVDEEEDLNRLKLHFANQTVLTQSQKNLALFLNT